MKEVLEKNTFYIEFDSLFSHKEGEIVLSPTKNRLIYSSTLMTIRHTKK